MTRCFQRIIGIFCPVIEFSDNVITWPGHWKWNILNPYVSFGRHLSNNGSCRVAMCNDSWGPSRKGRSFKIINKGDFNIFTGPAAIPYGGNSGICRSNREWRSRYLCWRRTIGGNRCSRCCEIYADCTTEGRVKSGPERLKFFQYAAGLS